MNYQQPDLLDQLTGAYVLGRLRGRARARFERRYAQSAVVRAARHRWEDDFMPLLPSLEPVMPSERVWTEIASRIRHIENPPQSSRRSTRPWRWALAGMLALSLLVGVSIGLLYPPLQAVQSDPPKAYELSAVPRNGQAPVSLGLLPRNLTIQRALSAAQRAALLGANRLAVSLEPLGGSKTGHATGPVLYVADVSSAG